MKLHRIEISGFKSFVDPVEVTFAGGITAIVGPNGCGKSNLADAIVWVLGEQSAKSLRGATMEDVVFNGSASRKPVGMAEVTLELVTDPAFEHAVDGKVRISRRFFRDGHGQYRLNDKNVRLKTIKDLLMDTGLGIRAYSVIEQGRIGQILSGKPQERRKLLEEAAGITRYKARKRLAEVKLEEATANLLRLDDIVSEVERALRSLKRQANAARRYQEHEAERGRLQRQVLLGRWLHQRDRLVALEGRVQELTEHEAEQTAALAQREAALVRDRETLETRAEALALRHRQQAELAATIEGRQEFLKGARRTSEDLVERLREGRQQAAGRQEELAALEASLGRLDARSVELLAEHREAAREVAEDDHEIDAARQRVEAGEGQLEALRQQLMESLARLTQLRSELQRQQVEIERHDFRRRHVHEAAERLGRQAAEIQSAVDQGEGEAQAARESLEVLLRERATTAAELETALGREADLSERRSDLRAGLSTLRERRKILEELTEEHAERRRALLCDLEAIGLESVTFLADLVDPLPGWEGDIDHFLEELADAVVLEPAGDVLGTAEALAERHRSGVFLQPSPERAPPPEVDDPAVLHPLADALRLPEAVAEALPPAYLVAEVADAVRLARRHPGVAFIARGVWAGAGTVHVRGAEAAPGVLARESELAAVAGEIPRLEVEQQETESGLQAVVGERTRCAAAIHQRDAEIAELRKQIAVAQARLQDLGARRQKLHDEMASAERERADLDERLARGDDEKARLGAELETAEAAHQGLSEALERAQATVDEEREAREGLRTAGAGRRGRLELLEERLESHNQEAARVRRELEEGARQLKAWRETEAALESRMKELEGESAAATEALQAALEQRAAAAGEVQEHQEEVETQRGAIRGLEDGLRGERARQEELRKALEALRVERAGLRQDAEHLAAAFAEHAGERLPGASALGIQPIAGSPASREGAMPPPADEASPDHHDSETEEPPGSDLPEAEEPEPLGADQLAEVEAELARCRATLERLGPVNVLAAREHDEQKERHDHLTTQREDIVRSVESLRRTIREINATSSERFAATFQQVNQLFGETFTALFRGGEAEMRLQDEDDLLDTGIEIVARPPGKRLQNLMLLSGGEKALTAIALLFSLFQAKPSPFCILDEVDAPLDDANILRFVERLQQMARETQFLVVTHNKLTMEIASTLYGVTMEQRGISKLVAVELDDVQPPSEAAATA